MAKKGPAPESTPIFTGNYREFQKRRGRFEDIDNDINESAARLMKSMADVAEKNPEEFFGLKPTDRERFVLDRLLDPEVVKAMRSSGSVAGGDIVGGQQATDESSPGFLQGLLDSALKKIDVPGMIKDLIKDEKEYWFGQNKEEGERAQGEQTRERQ